MPENATKAIHVLSDLFLRGQMAVFLNTDPNGVGTSVAFLTIASFGARWTESGLGETLLFGKLETLDFRFRKPL